MAGGRPPVKPQGKYKQPDAVDKALGEPEKKAAKKKQNRRGPPKGSRNNPKGRPPGPNRSTITDRRRASKVFLRYSEKAAKTLVEIMNDTEEDGSVRVKAANSILDRAFGKPVQITEMKGIMPGQVTLNMAMIQEMDMGELDKALDQVTKLLSVVQEGADNGELIDENGNRVDP